jgi:NDP-sugar pyrophosphorylase family protein
MTYIDYGLGVISADVLESYSAEKPFDLACVYQTLAKKGHLAGLEVYERFYEIGSHEGLKEAEDYFFSRTKHELRVTTP